MYNYQWARNPVKLSQSVSALMERKKTDPSVVVDEQSILAEYRKRAGYVYEESVPTASTSEEVIPEEKHHDGRKKHG